jgi:hypothetical protein
LQVSISKYSRKPQKGLSGLFVKIILIFNGATPLFSLSDDIVFGNYRRIIELRKDLAGCGPQLHRYHRDFSDRVRDANFAVTGVVDRINDPINFKIHSRMDPVKISNVYVNKVSLHRNDPTNDRLLNYPINVKSRIQKLS